MVKTLPYSLVTRAIVILLMTLLSSTTAFATPPTKKKGDGKATIRVTDLRTERMTRPMSIDTPTPRLGWVIETDKKDVMQTAYHLIVASTLEKAEAFEGDLWDVEVASDQSQWVRYAGKTLRGNTRCYWRVKVTTTQGESDWSDIAMWNVGLLTEAEWQGQWIGYDHAMPWDIEEEHSQLSARYLRTTFDTNGDIRQATLYISGLGMYEAFLDGKKIDLDVNGSRQVLAPCPTDYRKTVLYNAFDVTEVFREGTRPERAGTRPAPTTSGGNLGGKVTHALAVVLGNGRYYTMQQNKKPYKINQFGYPKLRANLIIEYADGKRKVVSTNDKWKINLDGPIRSNNEYDGETYDARKILDGWTSPDYDDSAWGNAERVAIPTGTLRGAMTPNMTIAQTLKPTVMERKGDKVVVDMGQNMAGWLAVNIKDTHGGDTIRLRFAERLDSTGNIWVENLRHAWSTDTYIANGKENGTIWRPTFVYHGFRYVEVSGLRNPQLSDFTGEVVEDQMTASGTFATTDTILTKVYHNATWGVRSNYKGMPVDCPQRDERQPWLGDRTRGCYGEAFLYDNQNLYAKWVRDIAEAQREDGCIPDVAPAFWNYYSDDVTWPAALPMALDMLYKHYGNDAPIRAYYPNVKRWLEHLKYQYQVEGLITKDKYGDWCVPPEEEHLIHSEDPARITDGTLISTAYYYRICNMMKAFAELQGFKDDATYFEEEAILTKKAFNEKFLTMKKGTTTVPGHILYPDSTFYGNNTVTANLLPLVFDMIDDDYVKEEVGKNIVKTIINQNLGTVTCGVIGIGWLMHGLTDMGRSDMAWLLATNKKYPSWGYMAEHGATTIWELWNGDTASPAMNSGNHVMLLGDLLSWLYEDVVGIQAAAPGFKKIRFQPDFSVDEMDDIEGTYHSIYGKIGSRWKKEGGRLFWHVEVPANTTATVCLPNGETREVGSGAYDFTCDLPQRGPQIVVDEFLYKQASFPECHSASIVETRKGDLVATYFGGTKEGRNDVCIWVSRKPKGKSEWTSPQLVADGVFSPDYREACWNPVLYETPSGELLLYFKIGTKVATWKGWMVRSKDGGKTWSKREQLPDSLYGPIKNKPILHDGRLIAPTSDERDGWKIYFEYSDDMGKTWRRTNFVETDPGVKAIQPTILVLPDGRLEALCRTRSRHIGVTFSSDNGETWSKLQLIDTPNNNSGIDAVNLDGGGYALVCNEWPIEPDKEKGARTPLSILRSEDGIHWSHWVTLEDSPILQYSYPSIIQSRDGRLHVVYTWRRQRVKHIELKTE